MRLGGWVVVAASAVAFYLAPKDLAMAAGAEVWGVNPRAQWPLMVSSLGVLCGVALLVYWGAAYRPSRTGIARQP
jgi:alpha-1,2-mannosyltransferase